MGRQLVEMAELVERWTLVGDEEDLVKGKRGATRLGFALLLKFYTAYGRFPRGRSELPDEVVGHVASQVGVLASELGFYVWSGSTFDYHRKQVRDHLGFRECSVADADKLTDWLTAEVARAERDADRVRVELLKEMRQRQIEPPTDGRVGRIVASALSKAEKAWFAGTATAEAVLSRFRGAVSHPAYQAMLEIGKAQRILSICRYLRDRDLQRQIEEGLNVVEAWNRANAVIAYGKTGEISTNRKERSR